MTTRESFLIPFKRYLLCLVPLIVILTITASAQTPWTISGTVMEGNRFVKNSVISISGPEPVKSVRSDDKGRFEIHGMKAGLYRLRARSPQHEGSFQHVSLRAEVGGAISGLILRIPSPSAVAGRIRSTSGTPLRGLLVHAFVIENGLLRTRGIDRTNDLGEYRIGGLTPDRYWIAVLPGKEKRVQKASRASMESETAIPAVTFFPGLSTTEGAIPIETTEGSVHEGVDFTLESSGTHCVTFSADTTGLYQGGGSRELFARLLSEPAPSESLSVAEGTIDDGVASRICGVPRGEYKLRLFLSTRRPFREFGFVQIQTTIIDRDVDLGPLVLTPPAPLKGKVDWLANSSSNGSIPENLALQLTPRDRDLAPSDLQSGRVDPEGVVQGRTIYPGSQYKVEIRNLPAGYYLARVEQSGLRMNSQAMRLSGEPVTFLLATDGASVSGKVNLGERIVEGLVPVVVQSTENESIWITYPDQAGHFSLDSGIPPGTYRVTALVGAYPSQQIDPSSILATVRDWKQIKLTAKQVTQLTLDPVQVRRERR